MKFEDKRPEEGRDGSKDTRRRLPQGKRPKGLPLLLFAISSLVLLLVLIANFGMESPTKELKNSELMVELDQGKVKSLELNSASDSGDFEVRGEFRNPAEGEPKAFKSRLSRQEWELLVREFQARPDKSRLTGVAFNTRMVDDLLGKFLISILPFIVLVLIVWFLFFRRSGGGIGGGVMQFGRSRAKMFTKEDVTITFNDVAGADEAKEEVAEIVEFLKNPARFTRLGAKVPRGLLMVGPPGCGKTLLAKAIAGEAERPFFSISGSDFVEMFVGVGASRVRDLFKTARDNAPCIIFIDEIDAVGRRRGTGVGGGHDEREQTLNAILVEMDGIGTAEGVIILAATNRADVLDQALLRPGRFDRQVVIDLPDVKGREEILRVHLKKIKAGLDIDPGEIARLTPGFSGADIANLVNEAALLSVIRNQDYVDRDAMLEARDRVRFGRAKKSRVMEEEERRITAYHEAGHTVVQMLNHPHSDKVHKVTIIPRGHALGATMSLPEKDRYNIGQRRAQAMLEVLFGGRAAEEIVFSEISAGAANDIQQATNLSRRMVAEWGMSPKLGLLNYSPDEDQTYMGYATSKPTLHSDTTAKAIDEEMRRLTDEAYVQTKEKLVTHRDRLDAIAEALLKYETLERADVEWIMEGKNIDDKRKHDEEERKRVQAAMKHKQLEERANEKAALDRAGYVPPSEQPGTA
ncbi:MAG: ATP-dependent zinc metalloprotease FtsH [Planctomycetes bacterium]|nr:ATP-dependent zinc metalloprotease FtsH [Planctomycetota bacterium]GIK51331.1 MAG: ATP-dependent zinc metalloprotease FtsH [Planctomycetota bacterium]HRJ76997.1 ATP-dependent zinc metalloprotease FtsH [Planctomycetota bacterium]